MEYKYLSDGRKVAVIGSLNNIETIVQEIFITANGDEVPSGERFVVRSLHDHPLISYKAKEELATKERLARYEAEAKKKLAEIQEITNQLSMVRDLLKSSRKLHEAFGDEQVERISQFITGQVEYLVVEEWDITPPVKMVDRIVQWDSYYGEKKYDGIKLCSILGESEGNLEYRIHSYSDGSGNYTTVYPCTSLDEAKQKIKERAIGLIESKRLSQKSYDACIAMGITFTKSEIAPYWESLIESTLKNKQNSIEQKDKCQSQIDVYEQTIDTAKAALANG